MRNNRPPGTCRVLLPAFTVNRPLANSPLTNNPAGLWAHLLLLCNGGYRLLGVLRLQCLWKWSVSFLFVWGNTAHHIPCSSLNLSWLLTAPPPLHLIGWWRFQGHDGPDELRFLNSGTPLYSWILPQCFLQPGPLELHTSIRMPTHIYLQICHPAARR